MSTLSLRGSRSAFFPPLNIPCLHVMSDTHFVSSGIWGSSGRGDHISWDLNNAEVPDVTHHLITGDIVDDGSSGADATALAWAATLPGQVLYTIGNHDVNLNANSRTPAQWAATYGTPGGSANYTYDLPWGVRLISLSFDSMADGSAWIRLSDATMSWLDAQLTAAATAGKRCYIACHAPLYNTVLPGSTTNGFWALGGSSVSASGSATSQSILDLLAAHSNVAAWIAGHTHPSIEATGLVTSVTAGSNKIAHISIPSLYYTDEGSTNPAGRLDRYASAYISDYGSKIEVRWRDHGMKTWVAPFGRSQDQIMTVTGLTAT